MLLSLKILIHSVYLQIIQIQKLSFYKTIIVKGGFKHELKIKIYVFVIQKIFLSLCFKKDMELSVHNLKKKRSFYLLSQ